MELEHFVITAFSIRNYVTVVGEDPLKPQALEYRFKVFELTCLPSIISQTNQNFAWVFMIDKDLKPDYRSRLRKLVQSKNRVHFIEFSPSLSRAKLDWLKPFFHSIPDYVLTTQLDDDDALPRNYVDALQSHLIETEEKEKLPPVKVIGARQRIYWELNTSPSAPLGYKKQPTFRSTALRIKQEDFVESAGFSLSCKYPEYNFSFLGLQHYAAGNYFNWEEPPLVEHVENVRKEFGQIIIGSDGKSLRDWPVKDTFYDISETVGPVLAGSHIENDQVLKFYLGVNREKVLGPETFPNIEVDLDCMKKYSDFFRMSFSSRIRKLSRICRRYLSFRYISSKLKWTR